MHGHVVVAGGRKEPPAAPANEKVFLGGFGIQAPLAVFLGSIGLSDGCEIPKVWGLHSRGKV